MAVKNGFPDEVLGELYPFEDKFVELDDGLKMHYIEMGRSGLRRPTFLLVHGQPTWSLLYREFMKPLAKVGRVIAVDHVGFGRSDHPEDPEYYSLETHIRNLEQFVDKMGLKRVIPVVHDWGGPIGLGYATRHPDDLAGLVILNTWAFTEKVPMRLPAAYKLLRTKALSKWLVGKKNLFVEQFLQRFSHADLPDHVMEGYRHPFPNPASRAAMVAFARMIPDQPDHPSWPTMDAIEKALPSIQAPSLILFSLGDPAFRRRHAQAFADLLPHTEGPIWLDDASHFLQEDVPHDIVDHILDWVKHR